MNRNIAMVTLLAFLAGVGSVSALTSKQAVEEQNPFERLKLGMSAEAAFSQMRYLDPAAVEGPVCSGADGIAARVKHLGMTWRLNAHRKGGKIKELVLERHSRDVTDTAERCRATFEERVFPHYNQAHASPTWATRDENHHLHVLHTTTTQQSRTVALFAGRPNRTDAFCTYRIVYR